MSNSETLVQVYKITLAVFLSTLLDLLGKFLLLYNPFYGAIGVFGNIIISSINIVRNENANKPKASKSFIYHVSTFLISFSMSMMFSDSFTRKISTFIEIEVFLGAFIIGMLTPSIPYIIIVIGNRAKSVFELYIKTIKNEK